MQLDILYEDEALLGVSKPAGSVVHWTRGAADSPVLIELLRRQGGHPVWPVHRLDRQASGVIVFAKSAAVAGQLGADLRRQRWRKRYLVLCRGALVAPLSVDHPVPEEQQRRPAQTAILPLEVFRQRYTLAAATPLTGRRHQLRYHFKHLRHPLVGDTLYGQGPINRFFRQTFGLHRLFLHAQQLSLPHPTRGTELCLHCPLSDELVQVLAALRGYTGPVA